MKKKVAQSDSKKKKESKSKEQLQQELRDHMARQVNLCQQEVVAAINPILEKYQCLIDVSVTLRSGQVIPSWNIVPRRNVGD